MFRAYFLMVPGLLSLWALTADAQVSVAVSGPAALVRSTETNPVRAYYAAPGYYGTSYGVASYGLRRTYSNFASPYGGGYGYGYDPTTILPGTHGVGIWNPGARQLWRTPYYGTYAIPTAPGGVPLPPFGVYAPAFGPGVPPDVYGPGNGLR